MGTQSAPAAPDVSVVVPVRDEEATLRPLFEAVRDTLDGAGRSFELIFVDDGSTAAVDYELVKREAGWLVFNVVIEGVSYVRNFRSEFDSEIRSTSLEAVIARLEKEAGIAADG